MLSRKHAIIALGLLFALTATLERLRSGAEKAEREKYSQGDQAPAR